MAEPEAAEAFRSRFEFKKELGKGGMGEVYLAHDAYTQRDVAIKIAKLAMLEDPDVGPRVKKMWLNETRLAGKLRHPYIVEIYEAGVAGGFGYLVMEYVDGGTLRPHCRAGSLALLDVYGRVARLLMELAVEREGRLVVEERLTQKDIGDRVGASREMVSRIFKDLVAGGYISLENRRITIAKGLPKRW